jgi:hypothetical protein
MLKAGRPGATCTLHVDSAGFDALEGDRRDALDHGTPSQPRVHMRLAEWLYMQEHLENMERAAEAPVDLELFGANHVIGA